MAAKSPNGTATGGGEASSDGGQPVPVAGGSGAEAINRVVWDPFTSSDWDKERHSKEALVRIKRYNDCVCSHMGMSLI